MKLSGRGGTPTPSEIEAAVAAVRRTLRPADLLFRSATDELAGLLLNTDRMAARNVALRTDAAMSQLRDRGTVESFQVGVACGPTDAAKAHQLLGGARERASRGDDSSPAEAIH